jgi:tetratricopeptide (TPR) repeat protein
LNKAAALGEISYVLGALGYGQAISGKKKEALQTLAKLIHGDHKGVTYSTDIAIIHLGLGETDRAFEYLEKAFEERESWLVLTCRTPFYDAVASNPRYIDLMRRIGLPLEQRHKKSKDSW